MAEDNTRNIEGKPSENLWDTMLNPERQKQQMASAVESKLSKTTALLPGGSKGKIHVSKENAIIDLSQTGTIIWQANLDGEIVNYRIQGSVA